MKYVKGIAAALFWVVLSGSMLYVFHHDSVRKDIQIAETTKQWNEWVVWRDANCHVTERMIGLSESSGKFHQNDNATVYDCGGIKYVVADSVEYDAKNQSLDFSQIPKLFDKK